MELIEIKELPNMDTGAPSPVIISSDIKLYLTFYKEMDYEMELHQRDNILDVGVVFIEFHGFIKYTFGMPGNETIQGHPYSKLGMKAYSFYELKESDLIIKLQDIDKIHPYYSTEKWNKYKHYILTFHDNMFECIAESYTIKSRETTLQNQALLILNEMAKNNINT